MKSSNPHHDPLTIDHLVTDYQRRTDPDDFDVDYDPLVIDRPAQRRSLNETSRVLQILDQLERGEG